MLKYKIIAWAGALTISYVISNSSRLNIEGLLPKACIFGIAIYITHKIVNGKRK